MGFAREAKAENPWGGLEADPSGHFRVPPGFTVTVLQTQGEVMTDGYVVPERADGMAAFPGENENEIILMRNHENDTVESQGALAGGAQPAEAYDPTSYGGVTRLVVNTETMEVVSSNLVLQGTRRNCAGGPSPWGWLTCEENVANTSPNHGYVFLCPTDATTVQPFQRIDGYGRYNHEAVAIDPSNNYAYLTEDRADSAFYRFVPDAMNEPFVGTLQALRVVGMDGLQTTTLSTGDIVDIEWVDIDDPTPLNDNLRVGAHDQGAAFFIRGEGCWFHEGQVYFCCTNGGPISRGQIFRLVDGPDGGTLEVVAQSEDEDELDMPDNITVHPTTGELYMAEDGDGEQFIRYINAEGRVCDFAENILPTSIGAISELAGVCFTPDGKHMFVNIQQQGITLAISGPFDPTGGDGDGDGDETGGSAGGNEEDGCACDVDDGADLQPGAAMAGLAAGVLGLRGLTIGRRGAPNPENETEAETETNLADPPADERDD